jgi:hypothetical protein
MIEPIYYPDTDVESLESNSAPWSLFLNANWES